MSENEMIGKFVLCRCHDAGVHAGILVTDEGQWVVLNDARRVWSWEGAASLSQLAIDGANQNSKIGCLVRQMKLRSTDICEILECDAKARTWFETIPPWRAES